MPREQLKSGTNLPADVLDSLLETLAEQGLLATFNAQVRLADHTVTFSAEQETKVNDLLRMFSVQPYMPPSVKQSQDIVGEDLLNALFSTGRLVQLNEEVLLTPQVLEEMSAAVVSLIKENGSVSLAELRDRFNTSRKYAVAVLEYLDATGVTIRKGESRQLRRKS